MFWKQEVEWISMKHVVTIFFFLSSVLIIINRIALFLFNQSYNGFIFERILFVVFLISGIFFIAKGRGWFKIFTMFLVTILLISTILKPLKTYQYYTVNDIKLGDFENFWLRQSSSIETIPSFTLVERGIFFEKEITKSYSSLRIEGEKFLGISEIDSLNVLLLEDSIRINSFYKGKRGEITFKVLPLAR